MKQKLYLLFATVLIFSSYSISQTITEKQVQSYVEKNGIKKKISELKTMKTIATKSPDSAVLMRLKLRLQTFSNFAKPEKNIYTAGTTQIQIGEDIDAKSALSSSSVVSSTATQKVWSNFLSTYFENSVGSVAPSPDPSGAVGSHQVIVVTNAEIKVFHKPAVIDAPLVTPTGYSSDVAPSTFAIGLNQFFSPVLPQDSYAAHPNIRYDRLSKRWFVMAIEINPARQNNLILLAVSEDGSVTDSSSFTYYSFNSSLFPYNHSAPYAPFLDIPSLGVDKHAVLIGGTQYGYDSVTFAGYVIDKEKLIHGQLVVYSFELGSLVYATQTAKGLYLPIAVYNDDPAAKKSFFTGLDYNLFTLDIAAIEYDKNGKPMLGYQKIVTIPNYNFTRDMSSPGGLAPVYNLPISERRVRFLQAAIHKNKLTGNSSLWTTHAIGVNQSGTFIPIGPPATPADYIRVARNASRWYKINHIYSSNPTLEQTGTVYDSTEPSGRRAVQYFNPSIATSGQGHSIISGTTVANNEYLNVFAAGRYLPEFTP